VYSYHVSQQKCALWWWSIWFWVQLSQKTGKSYQWYGDAKAWAGPGLRIFLLSLSFKEFDLRNQTRCDTLVIVYNRIEKMAAPQDADMKRDFIPLNISSVSYTNGQHESMAKHETRASLFAWQKREYNAR
jgi:hypothetical protein